MHYLCNQWSSFYVVGLFSLLRKVTLSNIVWCIVACFIRLSKVLSLSHFAVMEISGIKHLMEDLKKKEPVQHGSFECHECACHQVRCGNQALASCLV